MTECEALPPCELRPMFLALGESEDAGHSAPLEVKTHVQHNDEACLVAGMEENGFKRACTVYCPPTSEGHSNPVE